MFGHTVSLLNLGSLSSDIEFPVYKPHNFLFLTVRQMHMYEQIHNEYGLKAELSKMCFNFDIS